MGNRCLLTNRIADFPASIEVKNQAIDEARALKIATHGKDRQKRITETASGI